MPNASQRRSLFVLITPSTSYEYVNSNASTGVRIAFYDANKAFIGNFANGNTNPQSFTTPANARYLRFYWQDISKISINYPHTDADYHEPTGVTKTISLGTTIYGGILNVDSGVLTVTKAIEDIGNMSWTHRSDVEQGVFASSTITDYRYEEDVEFICSAYNYAGIVNSASIMSGKANGSICAYWHPTVQQYRYFYIKNTAYSDATAFKNAMAGQKIVYDLATPQTIQLTGEEITALLGENNVWASSGDVEVTYRKGGM